MSGDERINAPPVCIFQIIVALYQSRTPLGRYLYDRCHLGSLCQNTKKAGAVTVTGLVMASGGR